MAERVGGKWLFGVGVLCTAILTLLTPLAARWGYAALITLRILEGLGEVSTAIHRFKKNSVIRIMLILVV